MHSITRLGPYEITASIGAGGMGEVFRARDTRLKRDVAIKVLPKEFAADADRLRRFEQEARTLAALNHPNVLTIHDAGVHEGAPYLVSELLEGKTLRAEMTGGALPVRRATEFALQMAQGLAAAHGSGVIHRDLKPENIFVTRAGRVKILDFGLAKLRVPVATDARRLTSRPGEKLESDVDCHEEGVAATIRIDPDDIINTTEPGMVLGTPAYMSPEQVRGERADHRADIFAFGAVLYEMLSGTRAFRRDTPVASMNAVLSEEPPDLNTRDTSIPTALERIVRRCLEKRPERRFQSAEDLAFAIESIAVSQDLSRGNEHRLGVTRSGRLWGGLGVVVVLIAVTSVAGRWWEWAEKGKEPHLWHAQRLGGPTVAFKPMVSPDGKELAFTPMENGVTQLGVMLVDSGDWRVLTTNRTLGNVGALCWSRDGTELFYERWSGTSLGIFRTSKIGGEERRIIDNGEVPQMLPDGSLLLLRGGKDRFLRLHRYRLGGEKLEPLNAITGYSQFGIPYRILPGGKEVIFYGWPSDSNTPPAGIWLLNLQTDRCELLNANPPKALLEWASPPHVPHPTDGSIFSVETVGDAYHIVRRTRENYATSRPALALTVAPVDLDISEDGSVYVNLAERPVVILRYSGSNQVERLPLSASYETPDYLALPGGRLLVTSRVAGKHRLVVLSRNKEAVPFLSSRDESRGPLTLLGPDRILCRIGSSSNWVVSIVSIETGRVLGQLKSIPGDETLRSLAASPDGKTIYSVASGTVWSVAVEGGAPRKLRTGDSVAADPNGAYLLVQENKPETNQLVRVPLPSGPERIIDTQYTLTGNPLSPSSIHSDGRVAVQVALPESWYWPAAILDQETGKMELVPADNADMKSPGWDEHGRLVVAAVFVRSSLWRFRPEH